MRDKFTYRLTSREKITIGQNLVDALEKGKAVSRSTCTFICNWILTGPNEKVKAFFDVWEYVLLNYIPKSRPVLYRACTRLSDDKITSFTGRLECARKFSGEKGLLVMCDTSETLRFIELERQGHYRGTFYPIAELLKQERHSTSSLFSERFINDYIGEDEYIMRIDLSDMYTFKWYDPRAQK